MIASRMMPVAVACRLAEPQDIAVTCSRAGSEHGWPAGGCRGSPCRVISIHAGPAGSILADGVDLAIVRRNVNSGWVAVRRFIGMADTVVGRTACRWLFDASSIWSGSGEVRIQVAWRREFRIIFQIRSVLGVNPRVGRGLPRAPVVWRQSRATGKQEWLLEGRRLYERRRPLSASSSPGTARSADRHCARLRLPRLIVCDETKSVP